MNGQTIAHYRITARLGAGEWAKCTGRSIRHSAVKREQLTRNDTQSRCAGTSIIGSTAFPR
jgi:hypothetical protein